MTNFEDTEIELTYFSSSWGPFIFHIPSASSAETNDGLIPYDVILTSVTARAFLGDIRKGQELASFTEITSELFSQGKQPVHEDNLIRVFFDYPGPSCKGQRITLVFECGLSNLAKQAFFFNSVTVV